MARSLLDSLRVSIQKSGNSRKDFFEIRDGDVRKIRFISDLEDGIQLTFHSKWQEFDTPCLSHYGFECKYCDMDNDPQVKTSDRFAWTIYNREEKSRQIFMYKTNDKTPIPQILSAYEVYGTLLDRDFSIKRNGKGFDTSYTVVSLDKDGKRLKEAPFTPKEILDLVKRVSVSPEDLLEMKEAEEEEEEEPKVEVRKPLKKKAVVTEPDDDEAPVRKTQGKQGAKRKPAPEQEPDDDDDDDFETLLDDDDDDE